MGPAMHVSFEVLDSCRTPTVLGTAQRINLDIVAEARGVWISQCEAEASEDGKKPLGFYNIQFLTIA